MKGYLILASAIEKLKWECFSKHIDLREFREFSKATKTFQIALASKNSEKSKKSFHVSLNQCQLIKQEFEIFSKTFSESSEICRHLGGILTLIGLLKDLVATEREGNWEGHLYVIQRLLLVFLMSGSINDLRYRSWYPEKIRKLPHEHPDVYRHFQEKMFVVKTNAGYFKAVPADMKLEQSIQRSKKDPGATIGQTKHQAYVTEWELAYHEVLAISKSYGEISKSVLLNADGNPSHKELRNRNI